jgi:RNA polymerase sigma-70 factor (ECF subfamily)
VGAWIWGIAIRRLLDVQRGDAAQGRLAGLLGRRRIPDAASAEEQALSTLEDRGVIRALNRLAPELQAVLQATVLDGLSTPGRRPRCSGSRRARSRPGRGGRGRGCARSWA